MDKEKNSIESVEKKKRKTLDQYLGINGMGIVAIIGVLFGGFLGAIGNVAGITAIVYLIIKRKELKSSQKWVGWILVAVWLITFGIISGSFK